MKQVWRVLTLAMCFVFASYSQNRPTNLEEIRHLTDETEVRLCSLDLSELEIDLAQLPEDWAAFFDIETLSETHSIETLYRRATLKRRLMAGVAEVSYQDLNPPALNAPTLNTHLSVVKFWQAKLGAIMGVLQEGSEAEAANAKFCVINELGGAAYAAARQATLDAWDDWPPGDQIEALEAASALLNMSILKQDAFRSRWLSKLKNPEMLTEEEIVALSMMRSRETSILPFEPRDVEAFKDVRLIETKAILAYIERHRWKTLGEELEARSNIDQ